VQCSAVQCSAVQYSAVQCQAPGSVGPPLPLSVRKEGRPESLSQISRSLLWPLGAEGPAAGAIYHYGPNMKPTNPIWPKIVLKEIIH
jgi:hypothetical protein